MGRGETARVALWERRRERTRELKSRWPFAEEVLEFYGAVLEFQIGLTARLPRRLPEDVRFLAASFAPLVALVGLRGPPVLAEAALIWRDGGHAEREQALRGFWQGEAVEPVAAFFPKVLLQPYAAARAATWTTEEEERADAGPSAACPFCHHAPAVSVLRDDKAADTAARSLLCSLCSLEWSYPRVLCPSCKEERPEKLPRYAAEEVPWVRVEACEACRRYLKAVDLTKDPAAEPAVDELASTPLDVLAQEQGYVKVVPNLAGV
jgi:FdhE protein